MRNLFLTLVLLVTGITNAQENETEWIGNWGFGVSESYVRTFTFDQSDTTVGFYFWKDLRDESLSSDLLFDDPVGGSGSVTVYMTIDGGVTFKQERVSYDPTGKLIPILSLIQQYDIANKFLEANEVWISVNGKVYKYKTGDDLINSLDKLMNYTVNPFGAATNPFKG